MKKYIYDHCLLLPSLHDFGLKIYPLLPRITCSSTTMQKHSPGRFKQNSILQKDDSRYNTEAWTSLNYVDNSTATATDRQTFPATLKSGWQGGQWLRQ